jgi:hypothetical protein
VVREVACEWKEAVGDLALLRWLLLLRVLWWCEEVELLEEEELVSSELLDDDTEPPRLRSPFPLAHLVIAFSITEGMILKPIPLEEEDEEEDEEEELDDEMEAAAMEGNGIETWGCAEAGVRGSPPL